MNDRGRQTDRRIRPIVESLEGRMLLSTIHALTTSTSNRDKRQPAAYKPPHTADRRFPPYDITVGINQFSDPSGSGNVFQRDVLVDGVAPAYSTIWLAQGLKPGYFLNVARSDYTGHYAFLVPVGRGTTTLQVFGESPQQNYSNIETVDVTSGGPIVAWDSIALRGIRNLGLSSAEAARDLALLHSAQYDAIASITSPGSTYLVKVAAPRGASAEAAANSSALTVLNGLMPSQSQAFTLAYNAAIAGLPKSPAITSGLAVGREVGARTLASRANDGASLNPGFAPSAVPGAWRPTPPSFAPASSPQFARVQPFVIASGSAFRPAAPPALNSSAYDQALAQVSSLGRVGSTTRSSDQTDAALFWADGPGSFTSPGHWNQIAEQIAQGRKGTLISDARLFAQLDFALADAAIASADAQYTFDEWRPVSAVRVSDPTFTPLVSTPASPSYLSDVAAYAASATQVLEAAYGKNLRFNAPGSGAPGTTRSFASFGASAAEASRSQVWGGVNFSFDAQAGLDLGAKVAREVLAKFPPRK